MLRIGLSSKDIASLNNVSVKAVEMSRYRLRKKLNLSSDESLVNFLQKPDLSYLFILLKFRKCRSILINIALNINILPVDFVEFSYGLFLTKIPLL